MIQKPPIKNKFIIYTICIYIMSLMVSFLISESYKQTIFNLIPSYIGILISGIIACIAIILGLLSTNELTEIFHLEFKEVRLNGKEPSAHTTYIEKAINSIKFDAKLEIYLFGLSIASLLLYYIVLSQDFQVIFSYDKYCILLPNFSNKIVTTILISFSIFSIITSIFIVHEIVTNIFSIFYIRTQLIKKALLEKK